MATDRPRFSISVPDEMYEEINDYWHSKGFKTQTKAVVDLIEAGLAHLKREQSDFSEQDSEHPIIKKYRVLDGHGKRVIDLLLNEEYTRCADLDEMEIMEKMTPDERADYLAKLAREFEEMHPNKKQAANE